MSQHDISGRSWVVTQADIEKGQHEVCAECPHALALNRTFGGEHYVHGGHVTGNGTDDTFFLIRLETRRFILAFDSGHEVFPGLHCEQPEGV